MDPFLPASYVSLPEGAVFVGVLPDPVAVVHQEVLNTGMLAGVVSEDKCEWITDKHNVSTF